MSSISRFCPNCKKYSRVEVKDNQKLICFHCSSCWGNIENVDFVFDKCPICTCRQFYVDKDFNQILGFLIMGVGIILVPITYGLSLPIFAFIDWLIYLKVPMLVACYRCGSEFRGFKIPLRFKSFMHHIGLKYDKYR